MATNSMYVVVPLHAPMCTTSKLQCNTTARKLPLAIVFTILAGGTYFSMRHQTLLKGTTADNTTIVLDIKPDDIDAGAIVEGTVGSVKLVAEVINEGTCDENAQEWNGNQCVSAVGGVFETAATACATVALGCTLASGGLAAPAALGICGTLAIAGAVTSTVYDETPSPEDIMKAMNNGLNRIDNKVDEMDMKFGKKVNGLNDKVDNIDEELQKLDDRIDNIDDKLDTIDKKLDVVRTEMDLGFRHIRSTMKWQLQHFEAELGVEINGVHKHLLKNKIDSYTNKAETLLHLQQHVLSFATLQSSDICPFGAFELTKNQQEFNPNNLRSILDDCHTYDVTGFTKGQMITLFVRARTIIFQFAVMCRELSSPNNTDQTGIIRGYYEELTHDLHMYNEMLEKLCKQSGNLGGMPPACFADSKYTELMNVDVRALPPYLTYLNFHTSTMVTGNLQDIPRGATYLNFGHSELKGNLKELPPHAKYLYFNQSSKITGNIKDLPRTAIHLKFPAAGAITGNLKDLPPQATLIDFKYTRLIKGDLKDLPRTAIIIILNDCRDCTGNIKDIPRSAERLELNNNENFAGNVKDLPRTATFLKFPCSYKIMGNLQDLPRSAKWLDFFYCPNLEGNIKDLPRTATVIHLSKLDKIGGNLKDLPHHLRQKCWTKGGILACGPYQKYDCPQGPPEMFGWGDN